MRRPIFAVKLNGVDTETGDKVINELVVPFDSPKDAQQWLKKNGFQPVPEKAAFIRKGTTFFNRTDGSSKKADVVLGEIISLGKNHPHLVSISEKQELVNI